MATHNAPKHDFAPAWLKIPSQENSKPSGSKQTDSSSEKSNRTRSSSQKDDFFHNKRHSGGSTNKYRHHSVEDDYYPYPPYYSYYPNGYGMQYGSQSSMYRSPGRDPKYPQHPGLRFGQGLTSTQQLRSYADGEKMRKEEKRSVLQRSNKDHSMVGAKIPLGSLMNGGYQPYYDLYQFDYYHGDPYFAGYPQAGRTNSKRSHYEREGRSNSKEGKDKETEKSKTKDTDDKEKPSFQEDFPSLNGEEQTAEKSNGSKLTNGNGVWEHPPHGKSGSSKFGDRSASMYKSLVPNKGNLVRKPNKDAIRFNGGFPTKDSYGSGKSLLSPTGSGGLPNKENLRQSPTPPMDILNTKFITQPRNLGDKKSEFLKALRKGSSTGNDVENETSNHWDRKGYEEKLSNGVETLDFSDVENGILSSSQEAEERLLRQMGWNETDDEVYEITEDDKKKFQDMFSKQAPHHKDGNRFLPSKTLSPKHIPLYYHTTEQEQLNDTLSSSDSEEEESSNT